MRLADDDRGRVPFALVGALLLVAAAGVAATVSRPTPEPARPDAAVAVERATAGARTALRTAVSTALARGAANPVVSPADTPYGRVLNDSRPYRDALSVRGYVRVERALAATTVRVGDATATLSLPDVDDPDDLRAAKRRVSLSGRGNATVAVAVRNVSLTVRVDDRVVRREKRSFAVTVASPALALHDQVAAYDERLSRGAVAGHGFGRQFAARLYALAWLRGGAQYAGGPVGNVLATRHVALAANGAALATQRGTFGRADAAGVRAYRRAIARVGVREFTQQWKRPGANAERYLDAVLGSHPGGTFAYTSPDVPAIPEPDAGPESALSVSVGATADDAFAAFLAGEDGPGLDAVVGASYDAALRPAVRTRTVERAPTPDPRSPGPNWTAGSTTTSRDVAVADGSGPIPAPRADETRVHAATRSVTVTRTARTTWTRRNETTERTERTETTDTTQGRVRVGVAVHASHRPNASDRVDLDAVTGAVPSAFRERSDVDPNLVDVARDADRALAVQGGVDSIAGRAAVGDPGLRTIPARGRTTNRTRAVVYDAVATLREDVRNLSVAVERESALTGDPATAALLDAVRDRRAALAPARAEYDSVAALATVAAERAYLARVEARLEARVRADERVLSRARRAVDRTVADVTDRAVGGVAAVQRAIQDTDDDPPPAASNHLVGDVDVAVMGSPSYLVVDGVDAERVPSVARASSVHPLAARNVNVFTVPSGDVASRVVDAVAPGAGGTTLRAAVRQLERAGDVPEADRTDALTGRENRVRDAVAASVAATRGRVASTLAARTALERDVASAAVADAFATYSTTAARGRAIVNESATARIVAATAERAADTAGVSTVDAQFRDATRTHVAAALRRARASSTVRPADDLVAELRSYLDARAGGVAENATREFVGGATNSTNASFLGLPLAPVPGHWYATANVWVVDANATYPTFAVRARDGTASGAGGTTYVRDGAAVAVDVDGDGVDDRLGYADRVTARATVPVAVVVPPGRGGLGDRNLVAFEDSPGWPNPVPDTRPGASDAVDETARNETANASTATRCRRGECDGDLYPRRQRPSMFHDQRHDVDGLSVDDLRAEYAQDLAAVVESHGVDAVVDATGLDRDAVERLADADLPEGLSLADAAAVLSLKDGVADPDTVVEIACDHLLLGMTTGVMDVDAVESDLAIELDAKEVQQKIERRAPMSFDEYVHIQHVIASRQR